MAETPFGREVEREVLTGRVVEEVSRRLINTSWTEGSMAVQSARPGHDYHVIMGPGSREGPGTRYAGHTVFCNSALAGGDRMQFDQLKRRDFITLIGGAAAWPLAANAQQQAMPVIGFFNSESPGPFTQFVAAFHRGLNETGYVEGKNVIVEYRWAKGQYDRLGEMAADLVRHRVAVIVTTGASPSLLAARRATTTTPTVLINGEPMQDGSIVVSFDRPDRNTTGVSLFTDVLSAKRLELVRELMPNLAVVALLVDPNSTESVIQSSEVQEAAHAIGQQIIVSKAGGERALDAVFAATVSQRPAALLIAGSPFFTRRRDQLVALAARYVLPTLYEWREFATAGGLISYGPSLTDAYRQVGVYAARILNGDKPADLPVQLPTKFELVINLVTAKTLGLTMPTDLLVRADEVIE